MNIRIFSPEACTKEIASKLAYALDAELPLGLFVSGGSALPIEAQIIKQLSCHIKFSKLTILPVDERFGDSGHSDSNIAGLQKLLPKSIKPQDILKYGTIEKSTAKLAELFEKHSAPASQSIAILGIGPDGHIAGILPGSPAANSAKLAANYDSKPYQRITLTEKAILRFDDIFLCAFGPNKQSILEKLISNHQTGLPMDILHKHKNVTIFTDNALSKEGEIS